MTGLGLAASATAGGQAPVRTLLETRQDRVVIQKWDLSCGAAALTTILRYQYGEPVTERKVALELIQRKEYLANPSLVQARQGFSLLDLQRGVDRLKRYKGVGLGQLTLRDLVQRAPLIVPLSLHGYDHFVVFRGVHRGRVLLADPAWGNRTMSVTAFARAWREYPEIGRIGFQVTPRDGRLRPNKMAPRAKDFVIAPAQTEEEERLFRRNARGPILLTGPVLDTPVAALGAFRSSQVAIAPTLKSRTWPDATFMESWSPDVLSITAGSTTLSAPVASILAPISTTATASTASATLSTLTAPVSAVTAPVSVALAPTGLTSPSATSNVSLPVTALATPTVSMPSPAPASALVTHGAMSAAALATPVTASPAAPHSVTAAPPAVPPVANSIPRPSPAPVQNPVALPATSHPAPAPAGNGITPAVSGAVTPGAIPSSGAPPFSGTNSMITSAPATRLPKP